MSEKQEYSGKPLAYLDHNILDGFLNCQNHDSDFIESFMQHVQVVYSDSTFQEIHRSGLKKQYYSDNFLELLENLNALYIKPILNGNFKFTGQMRLTCGSVFSYYEEYINEITKYDQFLAPLQKNVFAVYGGVKNYDEMAGEQIEAQYKLLNFLEHQITALKNDNINHSLADLFIGQKENELNQMKVNMPEFEVVVRNNVEHIKQANSKTAAHLAYRNELKINIDQINKIEYPNILLKICNKLQEDNESLRDKELNDFLQINNCVHKFEKIHAIYTNLNITGFRPEKKVKNEKKFISAQTDISHVAYASYCNYFITNDERLFDKSKVIYEYLEISTQVINIPRFLNQS